MSRWNKIFCIFFIMAGLICMAACSSAMEGPKKAATGSDTVFTAEFADNSSADAFRELLAENILSEAGGQRPM